MSITIYPYQLTQGDLEARLEPGLSFLPGQLLRFENNLAYGQVTETRTLPVQAVGMPECHVICVKLLYGESPGLQPQTVTLLKLEQMAAEVGKLLPKPEKPLYWQKDAFVSDMSRLGVLTCIEGDDFLLKYEALRMLLKGVSDDSRILVVDPLGIFNEERRLHIWHAGQDVRLSVAKVGCKSFLNTFGEMFPPNLIEPALRAAADHLQPVADFIGFDRLFNLEAAVNLPLKNLMLQNYHTVATAQIFANTPDQVLDLSHLKPGQMSVIDLSGLEQPWKSLFYESICRELIEFPESGLLPVLLYPENYLKDIDYWIQKADEVDLSLIFMKPPRASRISEDKASNRFIVNSAIDIVLQGGLTLGLPVSLSLVESAPQQESSGLSKPTPIENNRAKSSALESGTVERPVLETATASLLDDAKEDRHLDPQAVKQPEPEVWEQKNFQESLDERFALSLDFFESDSGKSDFSETHLETLTKDNGMGRVADIWGTNEHGSQDSDEGSFNAVKTQKTDGTDPEVWELEEDADQQSDAPDEALIIDLFAPPVESEPSFLSAEQLSALLSSTSPEEDTNQTTWHPEKQIFNTASLSERAIDSAGAEGQGARSHEEEADADSLNFPFELEEDISAPFAKGDDLKDHDLIEAPNGHEHMADEPPQEELMENPVHPAASPALEDDDFDFALDLNASPLTEVPHISEQPSSLITPKPEMDPVNGSANERQDHRSDLQPTPNTSAETMISASREPLTPEFSETLDLLFPYEKSGQEAPKQPTNRDRVAQDEIPEVHTKNAEPLPSGSEQFTVGDRVRHPSYGEGTVQKVIPMDETLILNITFDTLGKRLLDPALSNLMRV